MSVDITKSELLKIVDGLGRVRAVMENLSRTGRLEHYDYRELEGWVRVWSNIDQIVNLAGRLYQVTENGDCRNVFTITAKEDEG